MNHQMEQEMERTIALLQASMPQKKRKQAPIISLLPIAAGEMNGLLLLGLFAGVLVFGVAGAKTLSMPMVTAFCTAPMPMLLLFHQYVLRGNGGMRELEETFQYSYGEMLIARAAVISCYMLLVLLALSAALHHSAGENFLRLALCGAVPSLYLCALLLFLSGAGYSQETIILAAAVFWVGLCFLAVQLPLDYVLRLCPMGLYGALAIVGAVVYGVCIYRVKTRRSAYVAGVG